MVQPHSRAITPYFSGALQLSETLGIASCYRATVGQRVEALVHAGVRPRRPDQAANGRDRTASGRGLAGPRSRAPHGIRATGPHAALVFGATKAVPRVAAALALTIALTGCRARENVARPTPTVRSSASQGRPIGAHADARVYAVAAAVRF